MKGADLPRRLGMLALGLALAVLVAGTWLVGSYHLVLHYLTDYGYGAHAAGYGAPQSTLGPDAWLAMLRWLCVGDLYLPHFLLAVATVLGLVAMAVRRVHSRGIRGGIRAAMGSRMLPLAVFAALFFVALTTSRNKGSAFSAPVLPAVMVLAGALADRLRGRHLVGLAATAAIAVVALVPTIALLDLRMPGAAPVDLALPVLGVVPVTDGRGTLQRYEAHGGWSSNIPTEPVAPDAGKAWIQLSSDLAADIARDAGASPVVAFGFRHLLVNVNTVNLAQLVRVHAAFAPRMVDPFEYPGSVAGYARWIAGDGGASCLLLTATRVSPGEFQPPIDAARMEDAARQSGFRPIGRRVTPDGWPITLWRNGSPGCAGGG